MKWEAQKIWDDCECWIIGGGTSIAKQFGVPSTLVPDKRDDFFEFGEYLKPIHNKRVIGVNLGAFLGDWVDVAYWGDQDTYNDFRNWYDSFGGLKVTSSGRFSDAQFKSVKYLYKTNSKRGLSQNRTEVFWGKNSGCAAINLAYHLGAKRIILLGFDMFIDPDYGRVHWHAGYPDKQKTPTARQRQKGVIIPKKSTNAPFNKHIPAFHYVKKSMNKLGLEIINASPDSKIEEFVKIPVCDILKYQEPEVINNHFIKGEVSEWTQCLK